MRLGPLLWSLLIAAVIYVIVVFVLLTWAWGHEGEQWISDKQLTDPVSRMWCCGPNDCSQLDEDAVEKVPGGYRVGNMYGPPEFVPEKRALPYSPDGHYHACFAPDPAKDHVRCFIVPPPPS